MNDRFGLIVLKNSGTRKTRRKLGKEFLQAAKCQTSFSERRNHRTMFCQIARSRPSAEFFNME